ncbi:hypothetical protein ACFQX7_39110 [Luedemannella flava]
MAALRAAGTRVCEPVHRFEAEIPADTIGVVLPALARLGAVAYEHEARGAVLRLDGELPAASVHELRRRLPALTRGEAALDTTFDHYRPVQGSPPTRPRTDANPLDRRHYLLHVRRGASPGGLGQATVPPE